MKKDTKKLANGVSQKIQPLGDRVLLKELAEADDRKTDSGIYIPETVKEDRGAKRGKVIAVGSGKIDDGERIPIEVSVGDTVLFGWGDKLTIEGEEYYLVKESEISAIIK